MPKTKKGQKPSKSWGLNKVTTLSKEKAESLAATPLKVAGDVFKELARWRSNSLTTGFRI